MEDLLLIEKHGKCHKDANETEVADENVKVFSTCCELVDGGEGPYHGEEGVGGDVHVVGVVVLGPG